MSVKEHIYRKLSQELQLPLGMIKKVIDNQFKTALTALTGYENDSIEIAGLGKFMFNRRRVTTEIRHIEKMIPKYTKMLADPAIKLTTSDREYIEGILGRLPSELEVLKERAIKYDKKNEGKPKPEYHVK
jgi:nucleoid DNA-binding protein